ncbi:MAG TPA: isoamylase early set domain-containing protein [Gemmatimonadaceae bacterium]|nr:isoamylase early set domain-containing protein [Gemmatimonadaceae bacterium]
MNGYGQGDETDEAMPAVVASAVGRLAPAAPPARQDVERVMSAVRQRRKAVRGRRAILTIGAAAASVLAAIALVRGSPGMPESPAPNALGRPVVHFRLVAPEAHRLAVVGDFNAWDARVTPMTRDATTGAWVASIALAEGRYLYAFIADGKRWLPDPDAPLASTDDFGGQNSVLVVGSHLASAITR